jgi:adenylosuccinate synthase
MKEHVGYSELLDKITEQILKEKDTEHKSMLRKQYKELSQMLKKIIEVNIESDDMKYKNLLNNLDKANKSIKESLRDGRKVVRTIQVLSETISAIESIIS